MLFWKKYCFQHSAVIRIQIGQEKEELAGDNPK